MAGTPTTNLQLPTFASADPPDLLTTYNVAMEKIDTAIKQLQDAVATGVDTTPANNFTVADLAASGITAAGLVVNKTKGE